jgi:hypothetical protein
MAITVAPAFAKKVQGTTTLKDSQPVGTTDKKHKHQTFDLTFDGAGNEYTCRAGSMNPTDFVVGTSMSFEVNGKNGKLTTPAGKNVGCKIVRVELVGAGVPVAAPPVQQ